jgi:hypothetical protein
MFDSEAMHNIVAHGLEELAFFQNVLLGPGVCSWLVNTRERELS